jgi:hypothetical protein
MSAFTNVTATEELTVTLPKEVADLVRSQVATRNFPGPVEYLTSTVHNDIVDFIAPPMDADEFEDWLRTEIPRRCAEADAHPEELLTVEDMRRAIKEEIEAIRSEQ